MNKINVLGYITDVDPVDEEILQAASWFEWEYTYIEVTEEDRGTLPWMLAQGWAVYQSSTTRVVGRSQTEITGYQYWLKRRRLQSERVLQDMITEFTDAYNEGRTLNDSRYDELVNLYAAMVSNTEDEMIAWASGSGTAAASIQDLIDLFPDDWQDFKDATDAAIDDLGNGRADEINIRFDAKLAEAMEALVNRGLYNSTHWTSIQAGIERERQLALNDLARQLAEQEIGVAEALMNAKLRMREAILNAYARLQQMWRDNLLAPTEMRNNALRAMFDFMERRTDSYPGLEGLASIAAQLGYGEASSSAAS